MHVSSRGSRLPTVAAGIQVDDRSDADIDDAEEALVLLLELLLVEDLNRQDALLVDSPAPRVSVLRRLGARRAP
jgi:hypothetical protein